MTPQEVHAIGAIPFCGFSRQPSQSADESANVAGEIVFSSTKIWVIERIIGHRFFPWGSSDSPRPWLM
jgi:hypothetical protein